MDDLNLTNALQDYLEAILNLTEQNNTVRITDLALHLQVAKPTVTETVKTLSDLGLITHKKYGPLKLTQSGREQAAIIRKRHRVLREFLISVLHVSPHIAEKEACQMEHVISADTTNKLIRFLENTLE